MNCERVHAPARVGASSKPVDLEPRDEAARDGGQEEPGVGAPRERRWARPRPGEPSAEGIAEGLGESLESGGELGIDDSHVGVQPKRAARKGPVALGSSTDVAVEAGRRRGASRRTSASSGCASMTARRAPRASARTPAARDAMRAGSSSSAAPTRRSARTTATVEDAVRVVARRGAPRPRGGRASGRRAARPRPPRASPAAPSRRRPRPRPRVGEDAPRPARAPPGRCAPPSGAPRAPRARCAARCASPGPGASSGAPRVASSPRGRCARAAALTPRRRHVEPRALELRDQRARPRGPPRPLARDATTRRAVPPWRAHPRRPSADAATSSGSPSSVLTARNAASQSSSHRHPPQCSAAGLVAPASTRTRPSRSSFSRCGAEAEQRDRPDGAARRRRRRSGTSSSSRRARLRSAPHDGGEHLRLAHRAGARRSGGRAPSARRSGRRAPAARGARRAPASRSSCSRYTRHVAVAGRDEDRADARHHVADDHACRSSSFEQAHVARRVPRRVQDAPALGDRSRRARASRRRRAGARPARRCATPSPRAPRPGARARARARRRRRRDRGGGASRTMAIGVAARRRRARAPRRSTRAARPRTASPARRAGPRARRARSCSCASPAGASACAPRRARSTRDSSRGRSTSPRLPLDDDARAPRRRRCRALARPRFAFAVLHRVEERRQDARAARADRVAERDRAAAHVDLLRVEPAELCCTTIVTTANASLIS